ncbi:MAG: hypothetical protein EoVTN8_415 [Fluviibacter phosphoraccumulans EoVTN8]
MIKPVIAVDARSLSESITGIGRYTLEVLMRIVNSEYDFILYSHKPLLHGDWNRSNVKVITFNLPGRFLRMLWAQTYLPLSINQSHAKLFWSPAHRIPFAISKKIKTVVTIHDLVWHFAPTTMRKTSRILDSMLMPFAISRADCIITVSQSTASHISEILGVAHQKIFTTHLAANVRTHLSKRTFDYDYILFVGTLEPRKNLERLIKSYSMLPNHYRAKVKLVIVGGKGWGGINIKSIIQRYINDDSVIVLGYVSDSIMADLYHNSLFLAFPSLFEGFGLPILEAFSYGKPVLTSNISSMPEVAADAAVYVDPYDVNSMRNGLAKLIDNDALREQLSINAFRRIKLFSWSTTANQTLSVFRVALEKASKC